MTIMETNVIIGTDIVLEGERMGKKKVTIITVDDKLADAYKSDIENFFGGDIEIESRSINNCSNNRMIETDLILISTYSIFVIAKKYASRNCEIIRVNRTISKKGYEELRKVPTAINALLVNVGSKTVAETISLIYNIGRKDIELFPYYPGIQDYPKLDIAITPGEFKIVPGFVKTIIDIGHRVIDISTILDIISNLKLDKEKYKEKILRYYSDTIPANYEIRNIVTEKYRLEDQLAMLFENLNEGIIMYNEKGIIQDSSSSVRELVNYSTGDIIGKKITDIFSIKETEIQNRNTMEKVLKINGDDIIATIIPAHNVGLNYGGIAILKKFSDVERKMHEHRRNVIGKGHKSKYTLKDIIGSSTTIKRVKEIAIRMAKSESSILITGESGTGKELFAHIIHNNSKRKDEQFVAVICSSIPENLLESELFGYEDGAFTGARRGGKQGLFEIAHGGTLFLDEIGEMPLHLQNRLLRVLQEQEVMRIGGDKVMHIDVRIIAATNINLEKQIKEGKFRKDLYYRLNVLPLKIPPLRERKDDIFEICDYFKKKYRGNFTLSHEAYEFFRTYNWEGNIRELRNYVEYFVNLDKSVIQEHDIPAFAHREKNIVNIEDNDLFKSEEDLNKILLEILFSYHKNKKKIGRKQMSFELEKKNIYMSEQEVRSNFKILEKIGYVKTNKGRGGTRITKKGIEHLV